MYLVGVASLGRSAALDITMNEDDKPPEYSQAHRYPVSGRYQDSGLVSGGQISGLWNRGLYLF